MRLSAGQVHGVHVKDYFGIYRWDDEDMEPSKPIAVARVQEVFRYHSLASFSGRSTQVINRGDQAILLSRHIDRGTDIALVYPNNVSENLRTILDLVKPILTEETWAYSSGLAHCD